MALTCLHLLDGVSEFIDLEIEMQLLFHKLNLQWMSGEFKGSRHHNLTLGEAASAWKSIGRGRLVFMLLNT